MKRQEFKNNSIREFSNWFPTKNLLSEVACTNLSRLLVISFFCIHKCCSPYLSPIIARNFIFQASDSMRAVLRWGHLLYNLDINSVQYSKATKAKCHCHFGNVKGCTHSQLMSNTYLVSLLSQNSQSPCDFVIYF
jgi:hypothetical protein